MNSTVKTIMFWICILACLMVLITWVQKGATGKPAEIKYSDLFDKVQQGQVMDAEIQDRDLRGHLKATPKDEFHTTLPANYEDLDKAMLAAHVPFSIKEQQNNILLPLLFNVGPIILIGFLFFFFMRQMQSGGNKAMSFGKSRARLLSMQQKKITFKDVAGVDEAKEELKEIIEYLREPAKFQKLGGRIPKGVLLGWASGNRQDAAGTGRGRRGQRSVLLDLRLGFCRDVCGRGRKPRSRPLRARQEERAVHHLHRRN